MRNTLTIDLHEDNGGGLWFVVQEEELAIVMPASGDFLTDARLYRDSWFPEDFPDSVFYVDEGMMEFLHDPQTRHVATYRTDKDELTLHIPPEKMGNSATEYLLENTHFDAHFVGT